MLAKLIETIAENNDLDFRKSYSGRGMFGRQCIGVCGTNAELQQFLIETINELPGETGIDFRDELETLLSYRQDSMGFDIIIYWENLTIEE